MSYLDLFVQSYKNFGNYIWNEITFQVSPWYVNYFYCLIALSILVWALEIFFPWRKYQSVFRKDFWLDTFYMFFNFFLFSLIIYNAASDVVVNFFNYYVNEFVGFDLKALNPMSSWPMWGILLTGLLVRDFVQWWTHRLLHRVAVEWLASRRFAVRNGLAEQFQLEPPRGIGRAHRRERPPDRFGR